MNIGEPKRELQVEPLEHPQAPLPEPISTPKGAPQAEPAEVEGEPVQV